MYHTQDVYNYFLFNLQWIEALSCLALELDIYLVVHLAELSLDKTLKVEHNYDGSQQSSSTEDELRDDDFVAYSTQVVFDRSGAVIARWVYTFLSVSVCVYIQLQRLY